MSEASTEVLAKMWTSKDGSLTAEQAVDRVNRLHPGSDRQALLTLALLMGKPMSPARVQRSSNDIDWLDLMIDEFRRIRSCPAADDEIKGLCDRAVANTHQRVPVIVQRDQLVASQQFESTLVATTLAGDDIRDLLASRQGAFTVGNGQLLTLVKNYLKLRRDCDDYHECSEVVADIRSIVKATGEDVRNDVRALIQERNQLSSVVDQLRAEWAKRREELPSLTALERAEKAEAALAEARGRATQADAGVGRIAEERDRLLGVLEHICGGDRPCTDESKLRQWAYEAVTLGRSAEDLS